MIKLEDHLGRRFEKLRISLLNTQCRLVNDSAIDAVRFKNADRSICDLNLSTCVAPDSVGTLTKRH